MLAVWTFIGQSWRLPIALAWTFATKLLCNATWKIRYPEDYQWGFPGFYSLTVPYGMNNDFHFTLHVALLLIFFQELNAMHYFKAAKLSFFVCVLQALVSIVTRGAYSIDIFGAVIFGFFFWHVGEYLSYYIDVRVFGLTFQERFPTF